MKGKVLRRPSQPWLIALLLLALCISPQSPIMAMPAAMPSAGPHMHTLSHAPHHAAMEDAFHRHSHSDPCLHCGGHCSSCGVCYSSLPAAGMISALRPVAIPPDGPVSTPPSKIYLPPEPFPPRS